MNLFKLDLTDFSQFVTSPEKEILNLMSVFEETIADHGADTFRPMLSVYEKVETLCISIECRDYTDKDDMHQAFTEMLHAFEAFEAHSAIFTNDVRMTTYENADPHSKKQEQLEALSLSFISTDSSGMIILPYTYQDKKIIWNEEEFHVTVLGEGDPRKIYQGDMVELLHMMTHLDGKLFTVSQLLNYYTYKKFNFILHIDALIASIKVPIKL